MSHKQKGIDLAWLRKYADSSGIQNVNSKSFNQLLDELAEQSERGNLAVHGGTDYCY